MSDKFRSVPADQEEAENNKMEEIVSQLKNAKKKTEKIKLLDELWFQIKPEVSRVVSGLGLKYKNLLDRYKPGTKTGDLESEAYEKLRDDYDKFIRADNFYNYFITAIRNNFFNNYVRRGMMDKNNKLGMEESFLQSEYSQNKDSPEENIAINEIKDRLIGWTKSGLLSSTEAMVLILHYGLGEKLVKEFVKEFKNESVLSVLQNINFVHVDFNAGMTFKGIASVLGLSNGTPKGIESRAVTKIKNELKV